MGNTGSGSNGTFGPKVVFKRAVNGLFAIALVLGAVATGVIAALSVATPASATPPGYQTVAQACWATSSAGPAEGATNSTDFATTSNPTSVLPGGTFTWTVADSGDNNVPSSSGGYTVTGLYDSVVKWDVPVGATITSGPTITQTGDYYNPATPTSTTPINWSVTTSADSNSPSGQIITLSETTNIPGGNDYTTPTFTITFKASSNPTSNTISLNMLNVPPVGSATQSTDPGVTFTTAVSGVPLYGSVTAALNCWPSPNPQPAYVTTGIIDNVNPIITIASPANNSQVVINSHVASNFSCIDPPAYGDGIASCSATNDGNAIANGALINTATLGNHTLTVTGINNSGYQSQQTSTYTVIEPPYNLVPPTINLTSPINGQQVITGSTVDAAYTCAANTGYTLSSCTGTVANGAAISTTAGYHTFTVNAVDTRGNPTTITVGYYARTSNSSTVTQPGDQTVGYTTGTAQYNCSLGYTYLEYSLLNSGTSTTCPMFSGATSPVASWKVTAPAGNGGQLAVGDTLTVDQQVYKPGWTAATYSSVSILGTTTNFGYYSGPYSENLTVAAPAGTTINGPITTSSTGLNTTSYGQASATAAAACNYSYNFGPPAGSSSSSPSCVTNGTSASASSTVGGSTTVGTLASTTLGTYASTSVASTSNAVNVSTFTGSGTLNVASITNFPTAGRLYVATTGGSGTATLSYTGDSTGKFTGVNLVTGSGTLATGGAVNRANQLGDINGIVYVASTSNFPTAGDATVTTSAGTDTVAYTGTSTTAGTCGTTSGCLTGVSIVSGNTTDALIAGTVARSTNLTQLNGVLPIASVNGLRNSGTNQVNVATSGGTAVLNYTGTSTTTGTCGPSACLTGVTVASGTGTVTASGSVTQVNPNVSTYTGGGILELASTSGFTAPGSVTVATTGGSATLTFTGTSTTAATCGAAGTVACLTGVNDASGTSGVANPTGSVGQTILENVDDLAAYGNTAAGANGINVSSLTGTQSLPALVLTTTCPAVGAAANPPADCFAGSGTLILQTSTGTATVHYTG
ncbi:MAG: beta strand repeat-containing protein, partial [Acidimicrobiales bacterium]